jgi:hypothetical protein
VIDRETAMETYRRHASQDHPIAHYLIHLLYCLLGVRVRVCVCVCVFSSLINDVQDGRARL